MKIFANRNIWKKIVLIFVLMFSVSFVEPEPVDAGIGGDLMKPICSLVVGLGDGVMRILHKVVVKQDTTLFRIEKDSILKTLITIAIVAIVVIACAIAIATGVGAAAGAGGLVLISTIAGTITKVAITIGVGAVGILAVYETNAFSEEVDLPIYSITPETIISGEMPLFDANFIKPKTTPVSYKNVKQDSPYLGYATSIEELDTLIKSKIGPEYDHTMFGGLSNPDISYYAEAKGKKYRVDVTPQIYYYTLYVEGDNVTVDEGEIYGLSYQLQGLVSKWYYILRTIAIVGMMSVLVYMGIRILISSTSSQKAKYKELMQDWLIGMVLLFTMHYIMSFANILTEQLTDIFKSVNPSHQILAVPAEAQSGSRKIQVAKTLQDEKVPSQSEQVPGTVLYEYVNANGKAISADEVLKDPENKYVLWHTNLMGAIRFNASTYDDGTEDAFIGYSLMYVVMVLYTFWFAWMYIKRVLYLAFLTMISPLVALTYPIDKASDGQAQGFNTWFKEYMFNLLLQPMHLLLYTILISSAIDLAGVNWIYSLVAIGFIGTAEKILRTLFNFQKAKTPGALAGPAGAALLMTGMKNVLGRGPQGGASGGKAGEADKSSSSGGSSGKTKIKDMSALKGLMAGGSADEEIGGSGTTGTTGITGSSKVRAIGGSSVTGGKSRKSRSGTLKGGNLSNIKGLGGASGGTSGKRAINSPKKGMWNGIKNAYGAEVNRLKRKYKDSKPIRSFGRSVAGLAGGALAGTIGLAAGIASGDPNKAFQYATLGTAGGYKFGTGVGDKVADSIDSHKDTKEQFERGRLGEEAYKKKQDARKLEEYKTDESLFNDFQKQGMSRQEFEQFIDDNGQKFLDAKIDKGDFADIYETAREHSSFAVEDGAGAVSSSKIEDLDQAIALYQLDQTHGHIDNKEERIQAIMDDYGVNRATAENFDSGRIASRNSRKGLKAGNSNIDQKMEAKRAEIAARKQKEEDKKLDREYKQAKVNEERRRGRRGRNT